jgi:predicted TIM-barrel fold metal-dependent hydrolase
MRIIDAHHHLWGLKRNTYLWLRPETAHPAEDLMRICTSYLLADFLAETQSQELAESVYVHAASDRADPVRETEWLQAIADDPESGGFPHGIVAFADLADPQVEAVLERRCQYLKAEPLYCATARRLGPR